MLFDFQQFFLTVGRQIVFGRILKEKKVGRSNVLRKSENETLKIRSKIDLRKQRRAKSRRTDCILLCFKKLLIFISNLY